MADEDVILASVSTITTVAAASRKRRRRTRSCWSAILTLTQRTVFINIHEVSTLLPIRSTLLPIQSTLSPVHMYGAKATRSTLLTFNKVDRVEFNFVVSVHDAPQ